MRVTVAGVVFLFYFSGVHCGQGGWWELVRFVSRRVVVVGDDAGWSESG